jgi:hypothetical protein
MFETSREIASRKVKTLPKIINLISKASTENFRTATFSFVNLPIPPEGFLEIDFDRYLPKEIFFPSCFSPDTPEPTPEIEDQDKDIAAVRPSVLTFYFHLFFMLILKKSYHLFYSLLLLFSSLSVIIKGLFE